MTDQDYRGQVFAVTSVKGGTGKSTIVQNLAVEFARQNLKVCVIDADPQGSLASWFERRLVTVGESEYLTVKRMQGRLSKSITDEADRYDIVIVDVAGRAGPELATALQNCDAVLIPSAPSIKDIETVAELVGILQDTQHLAWEHRIVMGFLNKIPAKKSEQARASEARQLFREPEFAEMIKPLPDKISYLPGPFNDADQEGRGVVELELTKQERRQARAEIQVLAKVIMNNINTALSEEA